jgi:hypothetical protein
MADYSLLGYKYGASQTAGSAGGLLTWAIDSTVPASFVAVLTAAFNDWSGHANIQFRQVSSTASATITFTLAAIDGLNNTLGYGGSSYYLGSGGINQAYSGSVTFDSAENWHVSGSNVVSDGGVNLFQVALHEIGHVLGLDHYNSANAVMNAMLKTSVIDLTTSDIDGIQYLYGPPASSGPWASLVDQKYYYSHNQDVAVAGLDAASHYNNYGWHEGRDPDADFSTNGYLAANADVAKTGLDPLAHYDTNGWKEGRDPSAAFDNEQYLLHNPDVKAAGLDPLAHYLQYGQAEGRQAYAAIGKASSFTHGSFDAEYYLLANPDVAKAALAAGGDTFAFAYQHYQSSGWQEHRNGDAYFDANYYLAHNPDVAAAHMDPLAHYDQFGWKEGRDPSAAFSTNAYLAANPDVAAAHMDPLTHYLQFGANEGRHLA